MSMEVTMQKTLAEQVREARQENERMFRHVIQCDYCRENTKDRVAGGVEGAARVCPKYKKERSEDE
ncbi:MAG: hypothetical protein WDZ40_03620 [Candidatus Spechtbacterales bacterium]